mgnify:CR=1 FL=1
MTLEPYNFAMNDRILATAPPRDLASREQLVASGRATLQIEADAVHALLDRVGDDFAAACRLLLACRGRVVVSGMGKSGHVARKIAATLASTGTPAFFMHPAEASHGDLGMVTRDDVFLALSNSGSTDELLAIVPSVRRVGAPLVALTGNADSQLARLADAHLDVGVAKEACPLNLAPTASTTAALAMGDAIAVALLEARGFGRDDFARSHPGGALGRRLLLRVRDVMREGDEHVPSVPSGAPLTTALLEVTRKRMGMTAVLDETGRVLGVFTDGDLRRLLERTADLTRVSIDEVMNAAPRTVPPEALAVDALRIMEEHRITQLPVADADGRLVGALHLHDLLAAKLA